MQSPREILSDLWSLGGGEPSALDAVTLTGTEPVLPSSFRVGAAAQATIAAAGLAAGEIWKARGGEAQGISVDMTHMATSVRGRAAVASIPWCRPQPDSIMLRAMPLELRDRRNCRCRFSTMPRGI